MDGVKSKENEKGMEVGGPSCQGDRAKKRGKSEGESRWTELVHSLGLPEAKIKEGLLTKDPRLAMKRELHMSKALTATTKEGEPDAEGEV